MNDKERFENMYEQASINYIEAIKLVNIPVDWEDKVACARLSVAKKDMRIWKTRMEWLDKELALLGET